jgi:chorismate dehydratase
MSNTQNNLTEPPAPSAPFPRLRIGCVPYLNARPLIEWFHTPECDADAQVDYAVPSRLADMLREDRLDAAMVSIIELFRNPSLRIVPDISISSDGEVKSVRLFSRVPPERIERVALDTSSLTSVALTQILLREVYQRAPRFISHPPDLDAMLSLCDAGLIIGDLKLFDTPVPYVLDLGALWRQHTGLPFVYAAWLARTDAPKAPLLDALIRAKRWGMEHRGEYIERWAAQMSLPAERVREYLCRIVHFDLDPPKWEGMRLFQRKCYEHGLIASLSPLRLFAQE